MKWLLLAVVCAVLAIIVMIIGVFRNNSIAKAYAETDEERQANVKKGQSVFLRYTVVSVILIVIAIIIRIATKGLVV